MFPKHNGYERIPGSFDLNLIVLVPLTNNYNAGSYKIFVFSVKLIEYIFPALGVCSNLCVGPFPKNKLSFFLLSIQCQEMKNLYVYQIQFHNQNIHICQYQRF